AVQGFDHGAGQREIVNFVTGHRVHERSAGIQHAKCHKYKKSGTGKDAPHLKTSQGGEGGPTLLAPWLDTLRQGVGGGTVGFGGSRGAPATCFVSALEAEQSVGQSQQGGGNAQPDQSVL